MKNKTEIQNPEMPVEDIVDDKKAQTIVSQMKQKQEKALEPLRIRMLNLIEELEPIKKIKKGEGGAIYAHYAHNDVQAAVMSLLPKHKIFMNTTPEYNKEAGIMTMHVRFECPYNPSDFIVSSTPVIIGNTKDEKGSGSAMSYALKYTLMRIFGLGGEDDPDDMSKFISKDQVANLESLLKDKEEIRKVIFGHYKLKSLHDVLVKDYNIILKGIMLKSNESKTTIIK